MKKPSANTITDDDIDHMWRDHQRLEVYVRRHRAARAAAMDYLNTDYGHHAAYDVLRSLDGTYAPSQSNAEKLAEAQSMVRQTVAERDGYRSVVRQLLPYIENPKVRTWATHQFSELTRTEPVETDQQYL